MLCRLTASASPGDKLGDRRNPPSWSPSRLGPGAEAAQSSFSAGRLVTQFPLPQCAKGLWDEEAKAGHAALGSRP